MKIKLIILFLLLFIINIWKNSYAEESIKIGYMICNSLKETRERFEPLTSFLRKKLGRNFESVYLNTYDIEDAVKDKKIDFVHANSMIYIILRKNYETKLVLGEKRGTAAKNTAGVIIVKNESSIKTISDLKGKSLIFGPEFSPAGYLAVYDLLKQNKIDPEKDLSYYAFPQGSYKHEKVLYAVYYQAFDAGAARLDDVKDAIDEKKFDSHDFRILAKSDMIIYCNLSARKEIDDVLIQQVKKALLELKADDTAEVDGEHLSVLKRAWLDAFVEIDDKDFDLLREMAKRNKIAPYSEY